MAARAEIGHARAAANLVFLAHRHGRRSRYGPADGPGDGSRPGRDRGRDSVRRWSTNSFTDEPTSAAGPGGFNLGVVLHQQGEVTGATAAYRRAEQRGDPDAAFNLGMLLYEVGDLDGAEAAWQRSVQRGNSRATQNLEFCAARRRRERETAGSAAPATSDERRPVRPRAPRFGGVPTPARRRRDADATPVAIAPRGYPTFKYRPKP